MEMVSRSFIHKLYFDANYTVLNYIFKKNQGYFEVPNKKKH